MLARRLRFYAFALVVSSGFSAVALAQSEPAQELRTLFRDVIANPDDPAVNIIYAQKAEELGETRKALAAYERVLAADPDNEEARREYSRLKLQTRPPFTFWFASLGGQYNTNTLLRADRDGAKSDDIKGVASIRMQDERLLGDRRVASDVFAYGAYHNRFHENDLGYASVKSGPIWGLDNGATLTTQATVEASTLSGDFLFIAGGAEATYNPEDADSTLTGITFGVSYAGFGPEFDNRDGVVVSATTGLQWRDFGMNGGNLQLQPAYVFNGASGDNDRNRFHETGATVSYIAPLAQETAGFDAIYGLVEFDAKGRVYVGHARTEDGPRRDVRFAPGVRIIGSNLLGSPVTTTANYKYERNLSTDSEQINRNHQAGVTVSVGF